jgi:formate hydrogenlyase subunit 3/multisubunit Na+/H+ antiporter MnhD subunit
MYLVLAIAAGIGMIAMIALFATSMFSGDIFEIESVLTMIMWIMVYMFGFIIMMVLAIVFFLKYSVSKSAHQVSGTLKKNCASCGALMEVTEMSCPRCFSLQPMDRRGRR